MDYNFTFRMFGKILDGFLKKNEKIKDKRKEIMAEYEAILRRAKPIDSKSPLVSSYALAALFISLNRVGGLSAEENYSILENVMRGNALIRMSLGNEDSYLSPKKLPAREKWSEQTHKRLYENDWEVDVLPGNDKFDLGYDYTQCGVCKLCRDEGCPELAKYLCRLDFVIADVIGVRLKRTTTLAEGGEKCDFRFSRKDKAE